MGRIYSPWPKDETIIAFFQFKSVTGTDAQCVEHAGRKCNLPL